jgi:hypothetical protein
LVVEEAILRRMRGRDTVTAVALVVGRTVGHGKERWVSCTLFTWDRQGVRHKPGEGEAAGSCRAAVN